jgi:hypothetical protein
VDIDQFFDGAARDAVVYSEEHNVYYVWSDLSTAGVLQSVCTAPWITRDANGVRVSVGIRNANTGVYEQATYTIDRYGLAGRLGRLLKNMADGAYRSAVVIALVDAFLWLRNFSLSPHTFGVSPLYLVIGLGVGALLYSLGWLFEYLFDRFYGTTPAAEIVDAEAPA